jgi:branched-chain amino acid transport system ATP-binding protein
MPLLEVKDLTVYYDSVLALDKVSFYVDSGEIVAIIGPNGAGKSTALKAISGLIQLNGKSTGQIIFDGQRIKNLLPCQLVKKGICLVPEGRRVFGSMTALENLQMGAFTLDDKRKTGKALDKVFSLFPRLKERQHQKAGTLSSGEQQMLAIGRALILEPKLLLVDEPSLGLSPNYVQLLFEKLKEINKNGTAILLVEQNARAALKNSHRTYIFEIQKIEMSGKSVDLIQNEKVKGVFWGKLNRLYS